MTVRQARGFRAARVDEYYLAAAFANLLQPSAHPGSSHHAAVRDRGIRTQDQKKVGTIEIRNGKQQLVPKHQVTRQVMGQLVDGSCGEPVPRMQAAYKSRCEQQSAIVMNGGIAKVCSD